MRLDTSLAFSHVLRASVTDVSSPIFLAVRVSKSWASFADRDPCSTAIDRALASSGAEMSALFVAAADCQDAVLEGVGWIQDYLPVLCRRRPRRDNGRGSSRRHDVHVRVDGRISKEGKSCLCRRLHFLWSIHMQPRLGNGLSSSVHHVYVRLYH